MLDDASEPGQQTPSQEPRQRPQEPARAIVAVGDDMGLVLAVDAV